MPNIKAPIKGIPGNATVDIVLRYPTEQLDAQGIPAPEYRIRSTDGGATWLDVATNAAPNVPASGEGDPYPTEPVEVQVTVSTLGRARTGTMWVLPVQDDTGAFDLSKPISPRGWVAPASLENLIATTEAARDSVTQATTDLTAERAAVQQALADTAQTQAALGERINLLDVLAGQGSGLTPAVLWPYAELHQIGFPNDIPFDPAREWTYVVTGAAGATSLTVTAAGSDPINEVGSAAWAANIEHDDGTLGAYTVTGYAGNQITVTPPLARAVTARPLHNMHWHSNHLTPSGYRWLGQFVARSEGRYETARYALAAFDPEGTTGPWEAVGGLTTGGVTSAGDDRGLLYAATVSQADNDTGQPDKLISAADRTVLWVGMDGDGQGVQWRQDVAGQRGHLDAWIGVRRGAVLVDVLLDGVVVHERLIPRGLQRVRVPFYGAQEATLRIRQSGASATTAKIGRVAWYSSAGTLTGPVLPDTGVILLHGDSWTQYHTRAWQTEMERLLAERGSTATFVNTGKSGMTSRWGLWWLGYQLDQHPEVTHAILEFGINDSNAVATVDTKPDGSTAAIGPVDLAEYGRNMLAMVDLCLARGVQPIVVSMSAAGGEGENVARGEWSAASWRPLSLVGSVGGAVTTNQIEGGGGAGAGEPLTITTGQPSSSEREGLSVTPAAAITNGFLQSWRADPEGPVVAGVLHHGALLGTGVMFGEVTSKWVLDGAAPLLAHTVRMVNDAAAGKGRLVYSDGTTWRYVSDDSPLL